MAWKADDHKRPENMGTAVERHERALLQRPGFDKLWPLLLLVIAPYEDQLRAAQTAQ